MIALSTTTGSIITKDLFPHRNLYWLGFIAQAGITLGFAYEIARRFPGWGTEVASIIIAVVAINQIVGPITFKFALVKAKETRNKMNYRSFIKNNIRKDTLS